MSREISFKYKPPLKFQDQFVTATGEVRATVEFRTFDTLWFNTGTLCNLTCSNCYIESSPLNDSLVYISIDEVSNYLDELDELQLDPPQIAFTGGEPFMIVITPTPIFTSNSATIIGKANSTPPMKIIAVHSIKVAKLLCPMKAIPTGKVSKLRNKIPITNM